jgi:hypothetical protein
MLRSRSFLATLCLLPSFLFSQNFTKITAGDIVSDNSQSYGCSWFDIDDDQDLDLFVGNIEGINLLYLNNGDGTFEKVDNHPFFEPMNLNLGHSWIDYDNDCDTDFYLSKGGQNFLHPNFLFENEDGVYEKVENGIIVEDLGQSQSSNWADIDNDGDLDLFIANLEGQDNFLYLNNGDKTFTKITDSPLLDYPESNYASFVDVNNDRFPDLFICNRFNDNNALFINQGDGNFEPLTNDPIVTDGGNSYSCTWGDIDNDGDFDCFVSNTINQANFLYKNDGNGNFEKIETGDVVTDITDSYSSSFADIDNDGDLDLLVMNANNQRNRLYRNDGNGNFTSDLNSPIYTDISNSRGNTVGDIDDDGDLDLFVTNRDNQPNSLYENTTTDKHWLKIRCYGVVSNFSAIGAKVNITTINNGVILVQTRFISSESSYASNNGLELHFGIGDAELVRLVEIFWPNGAISTHNDISADQTIVFHESTALGQLTIVQDSVEFEGSITLTAPSGNYFWTIDENGDFSELSSTYELENVTSDMVVYAIALNACEDERIIKFEINLIEPNAVFNEIINDAISIFPNPTSDDLFIEMEKNELKSGMQFILFDNSGRALKMLDIENISTKIEVSDFAAGSYFYAIKFDQNIVKQGKVIIQK